MTREHQTQPTRRERHLLPLFVLALVFLSVSGYAVSCRSRAAQSQLRPFEMEGNWICAPGPARNTAYFRKTLHLPGNVKHAWLSIAACDAFEVSANQNPLGRHYLWRPTRPFHNGMSEKGQRLTSELSALALNFPREYQWDGHDSYRVPQFLDLTSSLRPGKNVICVDVESRGSSAKACFFGAIELWSGQVIRLTSDASWRAEPIPRGLQRSDWTEPDYRDLEWRKAVLADPPRGLQWRTVDPLVFSSPMQGHWLRHPTASGSDAVWYQCTWHSAEQPDDAWLRVAANRQYTLFINGTRVRVKSPFPTNLDSGNWILGHQRAVDPVAKPELLDPDEVGSVFAGNRFESPRHADPRLENFTALANIRRNQDDKPRATNRADMPGSYHPIRSLAETRRTSRTAEGYPDPITPKALSRNRLSGGLLAYNVSRLLRRGDNRIEIRLCKPTSLRPHNWSPQLAVDGGSVSAAGQREWLTDGNWRCAIDDGEPKRSVAAVPVGPALDRISGLPPIQYRGIAQAPEWSIRDVGLSPLVLLAMVLIGLLLITRIASRAKALRMATCNTGTVVQVLFGILLPPTVLITVALLLNMCFAERHETLFFSVTSTWDCVFLLAVLLAAVSGMLEVLGVYRLDQLRASGHRVGSMMMSLPNTWTWRFMIVCVLLLCGFLRGYKLDYQPLDDDEYASTQAILSIVETGLPGFVPDDVYYTRSPLFHYVTAGVAWLLGPDLWTLRLQSVAWSMATALLAYLLGSRLLKSPWVGMGALVLISVHPFQIYTGHIIRFYQMQQFFALLTVYLFCKGFVDDQSQRYRYLTVASFLASVVSQEISVVMGVPLAIGFFLFARDLGWKANIKLAVVSGIALAAIAIDYAVFQTRCLTRVEGVSPNLEAAVKPHFWQPYNFLAIYIGYSRLHLLLSVFLLAGLPLVWRERKKNSLALHIILLFGVALTNLLVTHVSIRYQYWLIPIWILLSLESIRALVTWIADRAYDNQLQKNRYVYSLAMSTTIVFVAVVLSWSPWRIPGSYDIKILGDSTGAMRFVRSQMRTGDKIAASEPHTHCGFLEAGQIDYDISVPLLYDFAMSERGKLIDRNGGAEVVSNLDQLMDVCRTHDRVWILLNREKFRTRGKNMRWEYPGARFETFIRKNCELKHRTYLWHVYLWDMNSGFYTPFRLHAG